MAKMTKAQIEELATVYLALQEQQKDIGKELETRRAQLIQILGDANVNSLTAGVRSIMLTEGHRKTFDRKRFELEHPKLAPKYTSETVYDILKVT